MSCNRPDRPQPGKRSSGAAAAPAKAPEPATAPANGWGEKIAWREFDEGFEIAKREQKPLMLVVHTSWCSKCKALKPTFAKPEFEKLTEQFVMVNADQDIVGKALAQAPDGEYIPRILFFSPEGELDTSIQNDRNPRFRYYYSPADDLMARMRSALEAHGQAG